jgi:hypothetical protein
MTFYKVFLIISLLIHSSCAEENGDKIFRIPPASPETYTKPCTVEIHEGNPILTYKAEGVEITAKAAGIQNKLVSVDNLAQELSSLPMNAWKHGRIVSVARHGFVSWRDAEAEEREAAKTEAAAERVLESLGVKTCGRMR